MDNAINIWPQAPAAKENAVIASAVLELPDGVRETLWYRFPAEWQPWLSDRADAFLVGTIFPAMAAKVDLHVHGDVSPRLLENLEEYQAVWQCWKPDRYQKVSITADRETETEARIGRDAILTFSGGVDSSFTLYSHAHKLCGRRNRNIKAGIMVHGFDIPLRQEDMFAGAFAKAEEIIKDVGIPLIPVSTNWRELADFRRLKWDDVHATPVASVLSLFQRRVPYGLLANSYTYEVLQCGSNPFTDPLLSSANFGIIHDGADHTRLAKASVLAGWEVASRNLRVCFEGPSLDRNCGVCEKCVWTILAFRAVGAGLPKCFDKDITDEQILAIQIPNKPDLDVFQTILEHAVAHGMASESWVHALQKRLGRFGKRSLGKRLSDRTKRLLKAVRTRGGRPG
jgi:hypothetical protein